MAQVGPLEGRASAGWPVLRHGSFELTLLVPGVVCGDLLESSRGFFLAHSRNEGSYVRKSIRVAGVALHSVQLAKGGRGISSTFNQAEA